MGPKVEGSNSSSGTFINLTQRFLWKFGSWNVNSWINTIRGCSRIYNETFVLVERFDPWKDLWKYSWKVSDIFKTSLT